MATKILEIMRNRVFNLIFALLFIGSLTSMSHYDNSIYRGDCVEATFDAMEEMQDLGFCDEVAGCVGNYHYAECTGWPVTIEDYKSCLE